MNRSQGQIWYERALFYGQKGDEVNARRAYSIALRYDSTLPPLPAFRNHALLRSLERACLIAIFLLLGWLVYLSFFSGGGIGWPSFPWRLEFFTGGPVEAQLTASIDTEIVETHEVNVPGGEGLIPELPPTLSDMPEAKSGSLLHPRYAIPVSRRVTANPCGFDLFESYALLRNALYCYARDQGHFPDHLEDLVKARYLESIPPEPLTGNRQVYSDFSVDGGWVYVQPAMYAPPILREQVEMALYINHPEAPLTPFAPRSLQIDLGVPVLTLWEGLSPVKSWPVALGAAVTPTPVGDYLIVDKQILDNTGVNPFGTRWLKLGEVYPYSPTGAWSTLQPDSLASRGIGIHGTDQPDSIGQFITGGCIRMQNADVEELYQHIQNGIPVIITK